MAVACVTSVSSKAILCRSGSAAFQDLPTDRSVSRWLKRFTAPAEEAVKRLNAEVVARLIPRLHARTLTVDVDGTVLCTGQKVGGACRGYNPHHRKVPSYYPITAYLADSGHFLRLHNRPGNVNDGASSIPFLQAVFEQIEETLGGPYRLRFRMDGDFFKEDVFKQLDAHRAQYAIKVPFWRCLDPQSQIRQRHSWQRVEDGVDGFFSSVSAGKWKRTINVIIYRKRVMHATRKNYQLDLFDPDNGTWEYSAVATNLPFDTRTLWRFMGGRVVVEKVPWSMGKHHLTDLYRCFLAQWARKLSWTEVARSFRTSWDKVYHSVQYVVEYGIAHRRLGHVTALGVDEIQYRRER